MQEIAMKTMTIPHREVTIAYEDIGSGPLLVLLHAFPFDREMWTPQLENLADRCRIIAPDYPGFGASSDPGQEFTIDSIADVLADFLDGLQETQPIALGGLSMGGYVAMAFARLYPQRLRGLILADTRADADDEAARAGRDANILLVQEQGSTAIMDKLLPKLLSESTPADKPEVAEKTKAIGSRQKPESIVKALYALKERSDAMAGLKQVTVPTLILVGEEDRVTPPAAAQVIKEAVPYSHLITIPNAGHLSNLENPEAFNTALWEFVAPLR
jgi:3-oxoadipate enol-lactonase